VHRRAVLLQLTSSVREPPTYLGALPLNRAFVSLYVRSVPGGCANSDLAWGQLRCVCSPFAQEIHKMRY